MRPVTLAFVILGCVAAATAGLTSCADGMCAMPVQRQLVAVEPVNTALVEHHRQKRAPILGAALLGAGALGIGALGVGALGAGVIGAGALGAGVIGAGVIGGAALHGRSFGGGYGYSGPHYHYHSSPVVVGGGYGGGYSYGGGWGYGGGWY